MNVSSQDFLTGATLGIIVAVLIVLYILLIIAWWKIFKKAGEPGWKSLIPIYNEYIMYKISWKGVWFWITLLLGIAAGVLWYFDPGAVTTITTPNANIAIANYSMFFYAGCAVLLITAILNLICIFKLGKAFGHSAGFFIACLFFPNIAMLYLGFGKSEYVGQGGRKQQNAYYDAYGQQNYQNPQYGNGQAYGNQYQNQQYGNGQMYNNQYPNQQYGNSQAYGQQYGSNQAYGNQYQNQPYQNQQYNNYNNQGR